MSKLPRHYHAEALSWTTTAEVPNAGMGGSYAGNNSARTADGRTIRRPSVAVAAVPGGAVIEDDDGKPIVHPRAMSWAPLALRPSGSMVHVTLGCGRADLPDPRYPLGQHPFGSMTRERFEKFKALGFIFVECGCIVRQLARGTVRKGRILAREIIDDTPCPEGEPCGHLDIEAKARRERHERIEGESAAQYVSAEQKQHNALTEALASALKPLTDQVKRKGAK